MDNMVQLNDVVFSLHALFLTILTCIQAVVYERGPQKVRTWVWAFVSIVVIGLSWMAALIHHQVPIYGKPLHWLDLLYLASSVKLLVTLIKYLPQFLLNYQRRSTSGWSLENVLLDLMGGFFSLGQIVTDAIKDGNVAEILFNPVKVGMGVFSIAFDICFIIQHVVYRHGIGYEPMDTVVVEYGQFATPRKSEAIDILRDSDSDTVCNSYESQPLQRSTQPAYGSV